MHKRWFGWCVGLVMLAVASAATAQELKTAVFAGGCFWCVEEAFDHVDGVTETMSGYTGGTLPNPTYEQVSRDDTGHYEAVRVRYDPSRVSYAQLLDTFWRNVDPFDARGPVLRQGPFVPQRHLRHDAGGRKAHPGTRRRQWPNAFRKQSRPRSCGPRNSMRPRTITRTITRKSGALHVLQMELRPRATARGDLGAETVESASCASRPGPSRLSVRSSCFQAARRHLAAASARSPPTARPCSRPDPRP